MKQNERLVQIAKLATKERNIMNEIESLQIELVETQEKLDALDPKYVESSARPTERFGIGWVGFAILGAFFVLAQIVVAFMF